MRFQLCSFQYSSFWYCCRVQDEARLGQPQILLATPRLQCQQPTHAIPIQLRVAWSCRPEHNIEIHNFVLAENFSGSVGNESQPCRIDLHIVDLPGDSLNTRHNRPTHSVKIFWRLLGTFKNSQYDLLVDGKSRVKLKSNIKSRKDRQAK